MRSICALTTPAVFRRQGSFPVLKVAIPPAGAEHELEKKEVYNMPNVKNQETLVKIKEDLNGASAVWVVDYCGLSVKDIQALRREIREAGASMKVYKNSLVHIALAESELPTLDEMPGRSERVRVCRRGRGCGCKGRQEFCKDQSEFGDQRRFDGRRGCNGRRGGSYRFASFPRGAHRSDCPAPSPVLPAAWPCRSTACRAAWPRLRRLWPTRKKLHSRSDGGVKNVA